MDHHGPIKEFKFSLINKKCRPLLSITARDFLNVGVYHGQRNFEKKKGLLAVLLYDDLVHINFLSIMFYHGLVLKKKKGTRSLHSFLSRSLSLPLPITQRKKNRLSPTDAHGTLWTTMSSFANPPFCPLPPFSP